MDLLQNYNYVQLFWIGLTACMTLFNVYSFLTGNFVDIKKQTGLPLDTVGWFQFRKRVSLILFLAILVMGWVIWNVIPTYYYGSEPVKYFKMQIDTVLTPRRSTVDSTSVVLVLLVAFFSEIYRFHVSMSISIYSRRQTLNIVEAIVIYLVPFAGSFALIADAPPFTQQESCLSLSSITFMHIVGIGMVIFSLYIIGNTHKALAKLRRNRFGHITTTEYKLPKGGWFDVVCFPHYSADILLHIGYGVILRCHSPTWWLYTAYVVMIHVALASTTRQFYIKKFDNFPKDRKMLIPFVY